MAFMTSQKLKKVLQVEQWSEINTPEQFYLLMQNFHNLTPMLRNKIISQINDLTKMTEGFMRFCIDEIVEYEPSIMIALIDKANDIKKLIGGERNIGTPMKRKQVSDMYLGFSEWFNVDGEVQCIKGKDEIICSVSDAVEMAIKNNEQEQKEAIDMLLLTSARKSIIEHQELQLLNDMGIDEAFIYELLGDEAELLGLERPPTKYLN